MKAAYSFRSRQRGLTLIIVFIALVSLSLASVALIRSVDTGALVMGNLAFKQGATSSTDRALEEAMTWLAGSLASASSDLDANITAQGYYATSYDKLDVAGHGTASDRIMVDWKGDSCGGFANCITPKTATAVGGYTTSYVITRMCKNAAAPGAVGNSCAKPTTGGVANKQINKGETKVGSTTSLGGSTTGGAASSSVLVFRIVVRSSGPRNTVSYTETYISSVGA